MLRAQQVPECRAAQSINIMSGKTFAMLSAAAIAALSPALVGHTLLHGRGCHDCAQLKVWLQRKVRKQE